MREPPPASAISLLDVATLEFDPGAVLGRQRRGFREARVVGSVRT